MGMNDTPDQRALLGQEVDDQPQGPSLLDMLPQGAPTGAPVSPVQPQGGNPSGGGMIDPQMLMQLLSGPSQTQRAGQALAGGVAFMRGQPNPVTTMLEEERRQKMGVAEILMKLSSEQQQLDMAKQRTQMADRQFQDKLKQEAQSAKDKITDSLIASADPEARLVGWKTRQKDAAKLGAPIDDNILQSLARGPLGKDTLEKAASMTLVPDLTDQQIVDMYKGQGLTLAHMPMVRKLPENEDYRQLMGLTRNEDLQAKRDDMQLKWAASQLAQMREDRQAAHQNTMEQLSLANAERSDRRFEQLVSHQGVTERQAEERLGLMRQGLEQKLLTKDDKKNATFAALDDALSTALWRAKNLDTKYMLPKGNKSALGGLVSGDPSTAMAVMNRKINANDPDWRAWQQLNAAVIGIDRTVLQEIGPRAKQFFDKQMELFSDPPSLSAIQSSIGQFQKFLNDAKRGNLPDTETVTIKLPGERYQKMVWRRGTPFPDLPQGGIIVSVE